MSCFFGDLAAGGELSTFMIKQQPGEEAWCDSPFACLISLDGALKEAKAWSDATLLRQYVAHLREVVAVSQTELTDYGKNWLSRAEEAVSWIQRKSGAAKAWHQVCGWIKTNERPPCVPVFEEGG
ncbi:MAG: hypothetical protein Q8O58_01900 [Gallionella sp.]|nr:hypothetical protein [Gallionella sp.]